MCDVGLCLMLMIMETMFANRVMQSFSKTILQMNNVQLVHQNFGEHQVMLPQNVKAAQTIR